MLNFDKSITHIFDSKEKAYQAFLDFIHELFRFHEKTIKVDVVRMTVQIENKFISFKYNNNL